MERLRGEFGAAEESYHRASQSGRDPEPGLSLLRLAQGRVDLAVAAIRRVVEETKDRPARSKVLPASVEIMLAANDVASASAAANELSEIAADIDALFLDALSAHAIGSVALAEGKPRDALDSLMEACKAWRQLEVPHEVARARVLIALAYQQQDDHARAALELDGARWVFQQLGAVPDLRRVERLFPAASPTSPGGLTSREGEVLTLLATGKTNREISSMLIISEYTVARHVQNILAKLGVSSRTAATAFAFEHGLVRRDSG
jgi:ATP/maltotriose-dependent transcriptional regulator MalT